MRVTAARVAVLRVLDEADDHPRVDQVIDRMRRAAVSIWTQVAAVNSLGLLPGLPTDRRPGAARA